MLSEYWDKYKFHPGLVESGLKGFPKLEPGKFYTVPCQNYERISLGSGHTVWECASGPTFHGEHYVSYMLLTIGPHEGKILETFIYGWFGKGDNIVLELLPHQQDVMRQLKESVKGEPYFQLPSEYQLRQYRGKV